MAYISKPGDMFIRGANASGFIFGLSEPPTPPFSPNIVVPSSNPVMNILNPGLVNTLRRRKYSAYYADDVAFFATATPTETTQAAVSIDSDTEDNFSMMWTGYIYSPSFGDYVLETTSDDSSMLWIGDKAISGWDNTNADVNNGGLHGSTPMNSLPNVLRMEAGWYPIRVIFGENSGAEFMSMRMYKYGANSDEYISLASNTATAEGFN